MIKKDELSDPRSCMSRANDDEMIFVLLARDLAAPAAILAWCDERISLGLNSAGDQQIINARLCASAMERYRRNSLERIQVLNRMDQLDADPTIAKKQYAPPGDKLA